MTPLKWFLVIFAGLAIVDAVNNYVGHYFGIVACDSVILIILLATAFLVSKKKKKE